VRECSCEEAADVAILPLLASAGERSHHDRTLVDALEGVVEMTTPYAVAVQPKDQPPGALVSEARSRQGERAHPLARVECGC